MPRCLKVGHLPDNLYRCDYPNCMRIMLLSDVQKVTCSECRSIYCMFCAVDFTPVFDIEIVKRSSTPIPTAVITTTAHLDEDGEVQSEDDEKNGVEEESEEENELYKEEEDNPKDNNGRLIPKGCILCTIHPRFLQEREFTDTDIINYFLEASGIGTNQVQTILRYKKYLSLYGEPSLTVDTGSFQAGYITAACDVLAAANTENSS